MNIFIKFRDLYSVTSTKITIFIEPLSLLFLRLIGAKVFLDSGLTKWDSFLVFNTEKYDLFLYEFFCPEKPRTGALLLCNHQTLDYEEGSITVSLIETLAIMAGVMEVILPALLILGILTRIGAFGLLTMTMLIQLAVFPSWSHWWNPAVWWVVVLFVLVAKGPGMLSLDRLIKLEK